MTAGLAERKIAEFVDDDEIIAQQILGEPPAAAGGFLLFELIDEIDQIEETSPGAGANDRRSHADAKMGFARACAADEDRVAFGVEESAGGEFANLAFIDRRIREDELVDVLEDRKLRAYDTRADRWSVSVTALGADQAGDQRIEFVAPGKTLAGDLVEAGAHAIQFEFAHGL